MNRSTIGRALYGSVLAAALALATPAAQAQSPGDAQRAKEAIGQQLDELSVTLRAAVMSGALEGPVARRLYDHVAAATKAAYARDFEDDGRNEKNQRPSVKGEVNRLNAPQPHHVRVLLEPQFLGRDIRVLRELLDLDRDQAMVAQLILDDYGVAYDIAAAPLREALTHYRRINIDEYIGHALEEANVQLEAAVANVRRIETGDAIARMTAALERIDRDNADYIASSTDEDRAKYEQWKSTMLDTTSSLDARLEAIRTRTEAQFHAMGEKNATLDAADLVRMAQQLATDRDNLRQDVVTSLDTILTAEQRPSLDDAIANVRIGRSLGAGRLGGAGMNLWAAIAELRGDVDPQSDPFEAAAAVLRAHASAIVERCEVRATAAIAREIAGLEFQAERERIARLNDQPVFVVEREDLLSIIKPYVAALESELSVAVDARDALLRLLEESAAAIDGEPAIAYRTAAYRRGFPVETRRRWSERAILAALAFDVTVETFDWMLALESQIALDVTAIRQRAIEMRIERDPKLARRLIAAEFEDRKDELDDDTWAEIARDAFDAVDDRTEAALKAALSPEQFGQLPGRRQRWDKAGWDKADRDKAGRDKAADKKKAASKVQGKTDAARKRGR